MYQEKFDKLCNTIRGIDSIKALEEEQDYYFKNCLANFMRLTLATKSSIGGTMLRELSNIVNIIDICFVYDRIVINLRRKDDEQ